MVPILVAIVLVTFIIAAACVIENVYERQLDHAYRMQRLEKNGPDSDSTIATLRKEIEIRKEADWGYYETHKALMSILPKLMDKADVKIVRS